MNKVLEAIENDVQTLADHKNGILVVLVEKGQAVERHLIVSDDPRYLRETSKTLFAVAELAFYELECKRKAQEDYLKAASESVVPKDSGESAPGVGDGSYPKKCSSLPIERQPRTSKTSNEAKQKEIEK